ncbi:MAG: hypothetical protein ACK6DZ_16405 [Acidobacteriota bacterium]
MQLLLESSYPSAAHPGLMIRVRRISLSQRLAFLAANHELMSRIRFLAASPEPNPQTLAAMASLELDLSHAVLDLGLIALETADPDSGIPARDIDWILQQAPSSLCLEELARASDEIALSETRRKN